MRAFLSRALRRLAKRLSKPVEIDGLWVGAGGRETRAKVRDALEIIKSRDPRRYSWILKDLKGIFVDLLPGAIGRYDTREDLCELDERFVASTQPEQIASVIVHEATHARLWHRGIRYSEQIRGRVEQVCNRQAKVFASKMPGATEIVAGLDRYITWAGAADWSDAGRKRRNLRGAVEALRHLKVPQWLIGCLLRVRRTQLRRLRRLASSKGVAERPTATP